AAVTILPTPLIRLGAARRSTFSHKGRRGDLRRPRTRPPPTARGRTSCFLPPCGGDVRQEREGSDKLPGKLALRFRGRLVGHAAAASRQDLSTFLIRLGAVTDK